MLLKLNAEQHNVQMRLDAAMAERPSRDEVAAHLRPLAPDALPAAMRLKAGVFLALSSVLHPLNFCMFFSLSSPLTPPPPVQANASELHELRARVRDLEALSKHLAAVDDVALELDRRPPREEVEVGGRRDKRSEMRGEREGREGREGEREELTYDYRFAQEEDKVC